MRKRKNIIIIAVALLLISLSIVGYIYRDYINIYLINRDINVEGFKLLMSAEKAAEKFGKDYDPNVFQSKYTSQTFSRERPNTLIIDTIKIGRYKHRVIGIYTLDERHSVLGIKKGDKLEHAAAELKKRRFTVETVSKDSSNLKASRGNVIIQMDGGIATDGNFVTDISIIIYPDGSK